ncbi:MAG TPA: hypothetical protein PLC54_02990, partial [Spirochaetales bacterium]|nr:hypothetical protein [Spirochaetales bacterium]
MKKFTMAVIIAALIVSANVSWAQEAPVKGFDVPHLEFSLAQAERATEPETWLELANEALSRCLALWELAALDLYPDPADLAQARFELKDWTMERVAQRYASWLEDRFFGAQAARLRASVARAAQKANSRYLYITSDTGAPLFDASGNPMYKRPGDGSDAQSDEKAWREEGQASIEAAIADGALAMEALRPELLSAVPEGERWRFNDALSKAFSAAVGRCTRELDAMLDREERLFVARRTSDVWSLRQKSESQAAGEVARRLAEQTASECAEGLRLLEQRIESAEAGTGDLNLAGREWLKAFEEQFDRGLQAWTEAEAGFMARRMEWEVGANEAWDQGNLAWAQAFGILEEEQKLWELSAQELLESGAKAFSEAEQSLRAEMQSARQEFVRVSNERATAGADRAKARVDMYLRNASAMAGAVDSIEFWLDKLKKDAVGVYGEAIPEFPGNGKLAEWLDAKLQETSPLEKLKTQPFQNTMEELSRWLSLYGDFRTAALEARQSLLAEYGIAFESGTAADVLGDAASSEDWYLDEYQAELLRARAVRSYWERRVSVAQEVFDYASDLSAGRATEAESIQSLNLAKTAYERALLEYQLAQNALTDASLCLAPIREQVEDAAEDLKEAGEKLERLNDEYSRSLTALAMGGASYIMEDVVERYGQLLAQSGLADGAMEPGDSVELIARFLQKAVSLGYSSMLEAASADLVELVNGSAEKVSLSQLKQIRDALWQPDGESPMPQSASAMGIEPTDPAYGNVQSLLGQLASLASDVPDAQERLRRQTAIEAAVREAVTGARARADWALEARLDALAIIGAKSMEQWRSERGGSGSLEDCLVYSREAARLATAMQRDALALYLGVEPIGENADNAMLLSYWWAGGATDGSQWLSAFDSILAHYDEPY